MTKKNDITITKFLNPIRTSQRPHSQNLIGMGIKAAEEWIHFCELEGLSVQEVFLPFDIAHEDLDYKEGVMAIAAFWLREYIDTELAMRTELELADEY